jgi:hypothetical protein
MFFYHIKFINKYLSLSLNNSFLTCQTLYFESLQLLFSFNVSLVECIRYGLLQKELDDFASKFPKRFKVYYVLNQVSSFASTFLYKFPPFFSFFCVLIFKTPVKDIPWCTCHYMRCVQTKTF